MLTTDQEALPPAAPITTTEAPEAARTANPPSTDGVAGQAQTREVAVVPTEMPAPAGKESDKATPLVTAVDESAAEPPLAPSVALPNTPASDQARAPQFAAGPHMSRAATPADAPAAGGAPDASNSEQAGGSVEVPETVETRIQAPSQERAEQRPFHGPQAAQPHANAPSGQLIDAKADGPAPDAAPADPPRTEAGADNRSAPANRTDLSRPAEFARIVMPQIVEHVRPVSASEIEMSLHPAELGRIRMSVSMAEGGVQIAVLSDRPETQDLLRRHVAVLEQEFTDLGYTHVDINFGDHRQPQPETTTTEDVAQPAPVELAVPAPVPQSTGLLGRLDLRL